MHERDPEAINALTKPEIGYEYRDISVKGLVQFMIWFFVGTTVVIALTYVGFWLAVPNPMRSGDRPLIPASPNPLLQGQESIWVDIAKLRREEEKKLKEYGWVDQGKGVASIPIEKAMERVAERGLTPAPAAPNTGGQGEQL